MSEFLLGEDRWPAALPEAQRTRLRSVLAGLRQSSDIRGLAAGGSFLTGRMDEFSDLDLVVVVGAAGAGGTSNERRALAASLGPLLAAFPGDHVGEPRLLICLYGPPLVHVDLKFVTPEELAARVEDPVVLWDREGEVRRGLGLGVARYPRPDWQWIEDRFWVWVHYAATKIGRGERFEALDLLGFVRGRVLGPLALEEASARPNGVRQIEQAAPDRARQMQETVAGYEVSDILRAARATIALYRALREGTAPAGLERRSEAEAAAESYLDAVARRFDGSSAA